MSDQSEEKVIEIMDKLHDRSLETFKHCLRLWTKIGFDDKQILNRCAEIEKYFNQAYDDLIDTEEYIVHNIEKELEAYKKELNLLQTKLFVKLSDTNNNTNGQNLDTVDFNFKTSLKKATMIEEAELYKNMIAELMKIKNERKMKLNELKKREQNLCNILNESEYCISDVSFVDPKELENYEHHVNNLSMEKHKRISQLKHICDELSALVYDYQLKIEPDSSLYNLASLNNLDSDELNQKILTKKIHLDINNFQRYRNSIGKLNLKKEELVESIDLLRTDILNLWNKFQLKNSDFESLVLSSPSYNQETYESLYEEYTRCCALKETQIKSLIQEKNREIIQLVELCMFDHSLKMELERKMHHGGYTEDFLESQQNYLEALQGYAIKYEKLFDALKEWNDCWQKFKEFEKAHMDPGRFHQRGYSSLNEQRERDSFKNKLKKLKQQLKSECDAYQKTEGREFMVNGQSVEDYIEFLKVDFDKEKENLRFERTGKSDANSLRKKSVVKNFLTPQNQNARSSFSQKSLLTTQSPSSASKNPQSAKYSISSQSSAKLSTASIRMGLNFDSTPSSSRIVKSTPRKMTSVGLIEKKNSPLVTAQLPQKNKRRSSIKNFNDKAKKNQRRSKVPFEGKLQNHPVPEIIVTNIPEFHSSRHEMLFDIDDSILKSANMCESTHLTSSGVASGFSRRTMEKRNITKTNLSDEDIDFIEANTDFKRDQILACLIPGDNPAEDQFCEYVFQAFDSDNNGYVDFGEFLIAFWIRAKGSLKEKLNWLFDIYDTDKSNYISQWELSRMLRLVFSMKNIKEDPYAYSRKIFNDMDRGKDGRLTRQEFITGCTKSEEYRNLFSPF
ncbi:unnamed protein product [Brachionus calyciflorus]|uniref:EF-hand domain-containing protein n=1 Tax=Brachionus calyciflorus TaxID=104777 RepID=A0A813RRI2_9BILA|nr:unnamed protein product [Brachionus calyciflorus]